jgi:hypothetical protein
VCRVYEVRSKSWSDGGGRGRSLHARQKGVQPFAQSAALCLNGSNAHGLKSFIPANAAGAFMN